MKFNREQIIKALECCTNESEFCTGCPFCEIGECKQSSLLKLALALIKELAEEIKDLEADYDRVYEQAEADIHGNMADGGTSCHWCMNKTKADTVKRMCKRIEEESWYEVLYEEERCLIDVDDINLIAKELLEENK